MIQHIVLFTPKADLSAADRRAFAEAVLSTLKASPHIQGATVGRRMEVDAGYKRNFGDITYDYAAVLEFPDRQRLVQYLNEPAHAEVGRLFWERCERSVVCEVEAEPIGSADAMKLVL